MHRGGVDKASRRGAPSEVEGAPSIIYPHPLAPGMPRIAISKGRIESLSDLIFGLALSLGSIILIQHPPTSTFELALQIGEFALGFLILIGVWRSYTSILGNVEVETSIALDVNILLLLLVALEPYLYNLLWAQSASSGLANAVSSLFSIDIGGVMVANSALLEIAFRQHLQRKDLGALPILRTYRKQLAASGAIYFLAALPFFWTVVVFTVPLRVWLWLLAAFANMAARRGREEGWAKLSHPKSTAEAPGTSPRENGPLTP